MTAAAAHPRRILLLQGHPDPAPERLGRRLAQAYADGAAGAGHALRGADVATLDFPFLASAAAWQLEPVPPALRPLQQDLLWAEHLVVCFPLWLGGMPARLKALLEQVARPGYAFRGDATNPFAHKGLGGRSARVVVTMGMPAPVYRWWFRAHSVKALERNILGFVGIAPVHETLVGSVGGLDAAGVAGWETRLRRLGAAGA